MLLAAGGGRQGHKRGAAALCAVAGQRTGGAGLHAGAAAAQPQPAGVGQLPGDGDAAPDGRRGSAARGSGRGGVQRGGRRRDAAGGATAPPPIVRACVAVVITGAGGDNGIDDCFFIFSRSHYLHPHPSKRSWSPGGRRARPVAVCRGAAARQLCLTVERLPPLPRQSEHCSPATSGSLSRRGRRSRRAWKCSCHSILPPPPPPTTTTRCQPAVPPPPRRSPASRRDGSCSCTSSPTSGSCAPT
jgi:hypothetical protein